VSITLCFFSYFLIGAPRTAEFNLSERNLAVLGAMKDSTKLASADGNAYSPQKGSIIPNVVGCMQTNCMGEMQNAYKGGNSNSQGVMQCMNTFTGGDQQTCLENAAKTDKDSVLTQRILGCGKCNNCYSGDKPDNCDDFKGSNWSNNVPTNYIPEAYRGWMNGGGKGKGSGSQPQAASTLLLEDSTASSGSAAAGGFDYSQYMGGKGKGSGSSAGGFDYSQYMGGKGKGSGSGASAGGFDYQGYMDKYMPGSKGSGSGSPGGFDYSQYTQGHGADAAGASASNSASMTLVAEAAAPAKVDAPPAKEAAVPAKQEAAAPAKQEAAAPAKQEAAPAKEKAAPAKQEAAPAK
jgi:hypothetical protein